MIFGCAYGRVCIVFLEDVRGGVLQSAGRVARASTLLTEEVQPSLFLSPRAPTAVPVKFFLLREVKSLLTKS